MLFAQFAQHLQTLEETASRLSMTELLAQLYNQLEADEMEAATYLMQGQLVPEYESLEFGLSTKMIQRALARLLAKHQDSPVSSTAQTNLFGEEVGDQFLNSVNALFKQKGDLGLVAEEVIGGHHQSSTDASINQVHQSLATIARYEGPGSQDQKVMGLVELFEQLTPLSARYVTRIIMGKVRLGFSTMTLLDALSWAATGTKSDRVLLEEAYNKRADVGQLAKTYLSAQDHSQRRRVLEQYAVKNGVPVMPALAQRVDTTVEMIEKMTEVIVEPKYDGLRAQIHYHQGKPAKVYTRNLEDMSQMMPEVGKLGTVTTAKSFIVDGEAIGYDPETQRLVSFQQTITRKRKHGVEEQAQSVPLRFYIFDVLEIDGESLIDLPLIERKQKLETLFSENPIFQPTEYIQTKQPEEITRYHQDQLAEGLEGIIAKQLNSVYRGGRKGWRWVKMKEAEGARGKLSDTIDCVVLGYYLGKGKRSAFGIGAVLAGVVAEDGTTIKTITKIGTGLTDDQFREMKQRVDAVAVIEQPAVYDIPKDLRPDVWAAPSLVIEVAADEITDSPIHTAEVALRFPRLISFRDDKKWDQATTTVEVKQLQQLAHQ